jgi:hypothetical protein
MGSGLFSSVAIIEKAPTGMTPALGLDALDTRWMSAEFRPNLLLLPDFVIADELHLPTLKFEHHGPIMP